MLNISEIKKGDYIERTEDCNVYYNKSNKYLVEELRGQLIIHDDLGESVPLEALVTEYWKIAETVETLDLRTIKAGDKLKRIEPSSRRFTEGIEYNVYLDSSGELRIKTDDGDSTYVRGLVPEYWQKVEPKTETETKVQSIPLYILKDQMRLISTHFEKEQQLKALGMFLEGYEKGLNKWKRMDISHQTQKTVTLWQVTKRLSSGLKIIGDWNQKHVTQRLIN